MNIERARQIAVRILATEFASGNFIEQNPAADRSDEVGAFFLEMVKKQSLKRAWRFSGLRALFGRVSGQIGISQEELHEFFIEQILPFIIAEGLTATGHIDFEWSGHKK